MTAQDPGEPEPLLVDWLKGGKVDGWYAAGRYVDDVSDGGR